jgi:hypothetical protein
VLERAHGPYFSFAARPRQLPYGLIDAQQGKDQQQPEWHLKIRLSRSAGLSKGMTLHEHA